MLTYYRIKCRTGCTCCRSENHWRGFYRTLEEAEARVARFCRGEDYPVASQYARYGSYSIEVVDVEPISGDRFIVNGEKVFSNSNLISVDLTNGSCSEDYLESTNEY